MLTLLLQLLSSNIALDPASTARTHVVEQLVIKQSAAIWFRNTIKKMANDAQLPAERASACTQHILTLVRTIEFESRVIDQISLCLPPLMAPSGCFDHDGSMSIRCLHAG